jgi:hypothetical protein
MHNQLINTSRGGKSSSSYLRLLPVCLDASSRGWIALNWAAIQEFGHLVGAKSCRSCNFSRAIHKCRRPCPPIFRAVAITSLRCLPFSAVPQSFLPPPGHQRLELLWYSTKISVKGPIRQTWPNKHHSCCQLDDSAFQLPLQVALNFIRSIRRAFEGKEGFPHSPQPNTCQPDGHDCFLLLTGRHSSLKIFALFARPMA